MPKFLDTEYLDSYFGSWKCWKSVNCIIAFSMVLCDNYSARSFTFILHLFLTVPDKFSTTSDEIATDHEKSTVGSCPHHAQEHLVFYDFPGLHSSVLYFDS